ncbi:hypothetical protein OF001_U20246 [Pseudomonas sp. OF001]|uniref:hypothetical protein n=1 Tax=Pseudomonas sp. OF001 TaxID=2772300 RepID=UPI00191B21D2|nr:hypothetical protein [Pseudomonas sp. OF001]CAD5377319.1 hypothetical protein OF001_U20246 [Pseudomonas sp. OF001]
MQKPNTRPTCGFQPVYHGRRKFAWDGNPPRAIKKGEFYMSGAIPGAYEALSDSEALHFILVEVPR